MDEEEMLQRITRLLEQGCTMLATHHSCGAPLFRCRGEIVCPVCSFAEGQSAPSPGKDQGVPFMPEKAGGEGQRGAEMTGAQEASSSLQPSAGVEEPGLGATRASQEEPNIAYLRESVMRKLRDLTAAMEGEQDLDKLRRQLDCIEGALKVLRSMER
jgi:UPF0148 protein